MSPHSLHCNKKMYRKFNNAVEAFTSNRCKNIFYIDDENIFLILIANVFKVALKYIFCTHLIK